MTNITFEGTIVVPETEVKTISVPVDGKSHQFQVVRNTNILLHAIYVSNPNPVVVTLELKPAIGVPGKNLDFKGIFGNETKPVPFIPPIGPFRGGWVLIAATGDNADKDLLVSVQYSRLGGGR